MDSNVASEIEYALIANLGIVKTRSTKGISCLWGKSKEKKCVIVPNSTRIITIAKEKGVFFMLQIMQVTKITMAISARLPTSSFNSQGVSTKSKSRDVMLHSPTQIKIKVSRHLLRIHIRVRGVQRRSKPSMLSLSAQPECTAHASPTIEKLQNRLLIRNPSLMQGGPGGPHQTESQDYVQMELPCHPNVLHV
eukprot:1159864-Pelagomonas_calceolata.AAC.22